MEHRQFDSLTRLFARRRDRRSMVRGVAAFIAVTWGLARRSVLAQTDCPDGCPEGETCLGGVCLRPCATDRDCRSKKKDDPCMLNTCVDGYCVAAIANCQPGYECCRGECCAKSCWDDAECAVLDPCRIGRCSEEGVCVFTALDPCPHCQSDQDCRNGDANTVCCDGACKRPCPSGTVMGKGCECRADGSVTDGLIVRDDASG